MPSTRRDFLLAAGGAAVLAACGGSDGTSTSDTTGGDTGGTATGDYSRVINMSSGTLAVSSPRFTYGPYLPGLTTISSPVSGR